MNIMVSEVCDAFMPRCVGTKVVYSGTFMSALEEKIPTVGSPVKIIDLSDVKHCAISGVGLHNDMRRLNGYIIRQWRGEHALFGKRIFATEHTRLTAVVYERQAYMEDPQVDHVEALRVSRADYVVVAVLASVGNETPPVSSHRFVRNLAIDKAPLDILAEARKIVEYEKVWITVAD